MLGKKLGNIKKKLPLGGCRTTWGSNVQRIINNRSISSWEEVSNEIPYGSLLCLLLFISLIAESRMESIVMKCMDDIKLDRVG